MGPQLTNIASLLPTVAGTAAPPLAAPTPDAFAAMTVDQQIAYIEGVSADDPAFVVLGDPSQATPQVLETVSPDGKSVAASDVPSSYSAALASGTDPSANDFQSWAPSLQLSYLRQAGGGTQSATLVSGTLSLTVAVDATGRGVSVVQQTAGLASFWSSSTAAITSASAAATAAAGAQPTGAVQSVTPGVLSSAGAADTTVPYLALPGSTYGLGSPVNQTVADILFPVLDGDPTQVGSSILPTNPQTAADKLLVQQFNTAPTQLDADTFGSWNSAVQLQYLRANDPKNQGLAIGIPGSANGILHAFMSAPTVPQLLPQKVYVVENLQKQDISTMALTDQKVLAGLPAFTTVAQSLGLIPDGIDRSNTDGIHALNIQQASALPPNSNDPPGIVYAQFTTAFDTIADPSKGVPSIPTTLGAMPDADVKVFKDELTLIQTQAAGSAIFSPKDIQDKINAVITRFQRAYAFGITVHSQPYGYTVTGFNYSEHAKKNNTTNGYVTGAGMSGIETYWKGNFQNFFKPTYDSKTGTPILLRSQDRIGPILDGDGNPIADTGSGFSSFRIYYGDPQPQQTGDNAGDDSAYCDIGFADFSKEPQVSTTDQNAGITSGYNVFMTQEKAVLAQSNRAQALASNTAGTQNLDVPNLVYLFQLYTNLIGEATLRADTEQVNQTNAELQTYAAMQKIINQTVAKIGSSTDAHVLVGSADDGGDFTTQEQIVLDIFNNVTGTLPPSPIELLQGITRPTTNLSSYASQTGPSWSQFGTELSDTVTLLNQNSQLKMNDINAETKQKDRNFDLANSALSKMNDVLTKIASSIG